MKKIYITAVLFLLTVSSFSQLKLTDTTSITSIKAQLKEQFLKKKVNGNLQNTGNTPNVDNLIPNLVPPSPSAASLGKYTDFPVNIYNGLPSVPIPIHQLKSRSISVPISLNYHASGLKVGEVASWVGLGWSLDAGGVITRTVRNLPDETPTSGFFEIRNHYPNPDNISFSGVSASVWQEDVVETAKGKTDFEQDIYMLKAMGRSYKLIFKANGTILTIPHSDLKISVNFSTDSWEIILEDGTKLTFGGNGATEVSDLIVGQSPNADLYTFDSSWYLKSVTSHQGDVVNFTYTYSAITNDISFAESDNFKVIENYQPPFNTAIDVEPLKTTYKDQTIAVLNISSVVSDNETVTFIRQATQREDMTGDYALDKIKITPKNTTNATEEYQFKYHYVDAVSSIEYNPLNKTEFLKRLQLDTLARVVAGKLYQPWVFGYNPLALPSRRSYAQDHFGLYNGATTNTTLLPAVHAEFPLGMATLAGISTTDWGFFPPKHPLGANREPDSVAMQAQILTSVQYPTGGKTVFNFEANRIPLTETVYVDTNPSLSLSSSANPYSYLTSVGFNNAKPQYVKITFSGHFDSNFLGDIGDNTPLCGVALNQQNSGANSWSLGVRKADLDVSNNFNYTRYVNAQELDLYSFRLTVINSGNPPTANDYTLSATIVYQEVNNSPPTDKLVGGVRLAKTAMYDGLGNKASQRKFQYENPFVINPISLSEYLENTQEVVCGGITADPTYNIKSRNSNAKFALGSIQGGTVGYGKVTTFTDSLGTNGKTISIFSNVADGGTAASKVFPYPPTNPREQRRGLLLSQTEYRSDNNKVKEIINEYEFIPKDSVSSIKSGFLSYYGVCGSTAICSNQYGYCGVAHSIFILSTEQVNKIKTIERTYGLTDASYVETTMENEFGNTNYTAVTKTIITEGKSDKVTVNSVLKDTRTIETSFKYPYDFTTVAPYNSMTAKNIIAPVIEKTSKLRVLNNAGTPNYTTLSEEKTTFGTFSTNLYLPQKIETRVEGTSGTWITPVEFLNYDTRGNLTKYYQRNGQTTSLTYYGTGDYGKTDLVSSITVGGGTTGTVLARSMNYDYKPLVGLSTSSDVNTYLTKYAHDEFNRLKSVKDHNDFLLKDFRYHYRNETNPTGIGVNANSELNFVLSRMARTEQTGDDLSNSVDLSSTNLQYMDGLGRELQTLLWRASPDKTKDIIASTTAYDAFGRAYKGILPTPSDAALGVYKPTAQTLASAFYSGDTQPYSETIFEPSPLNRPQKVFGAGQAWRTANKFTEMSYRVAGTEVTLFDIQGSNVNCGTTYPASTLYNTLTISERGFWTIELKDRQGKVTHKFQQLQGGFIFAITAYVYDDLGRLRYVIPPEIYKKLGAGLITSFTEADEIFKEGMYGYHYDQLGRQSERHLPGGGWRYSIFDKNDREVMFADEEDKAKGYWQFRKFDALSRNIQGGLIYNIGISTRSQIQTDFDSFTGQSYEEVSNSGLLGYTNVSFPSSYTPVDANIMEVKFYDNYGWQTETAYNFNGTTAFHTQGLAKGLMTGMLSRNLETNDWLKSVNYFDYRGKLIQSWFKNHKGNIERSETQYRFNGEVLKMRLDHEGILEVYDYETDHMGRKTSFKHTLNGVLKNVSKYQFDEIGRLKSKKLSPSVSINSVASGSWNSTYTWQNNGLPSINDYIRINAGHTVTINSGEAGSAGSLYNAGTLNTYGTLKLGILPPSTSGASDLQSVDYSYHIRGGLRGVNLDASGNLTNKIFSMRLGYEDAGFWDGNIGKQEWKSNIDNVTRSFTYDYDGASRIKSGIYASTKASENYSLNNVNYDFNGNITNLSRNGWKSNNTFGLVDNLNYTYNSNSNKILKVEDSSNETASFKDVAGNDYGYNLDGSLNADANKNITLMEYNYLKLPRKIVQNGVTTLYQYASNGAKLREIIVSDTTDYLGNVIKKNSALYQISHDEGRVINGEYEYHISDHLGNLRIAFRDSLGVAKITQANSYGIWGEDLPTLSYNKSMWKKDNFKFTGGESLSGTGYIHLGARLYDNLVPRFIMQDIKSEKFYPLSGYSYSANNPLLFNDTNGEDWTLSFSRNSDGQIQLSLTVTTAFLNSSGTEIDMANYIKEQTANFSKIFGGNKGVVNVTTNFIAREIKNISEIRDNEHLVEIVPPGTLRDDANAITGADSQIGGKYIRVNPNTINKNGSQNYNHGGNDANLTHEFGHNAGLVHPFEFYNNTDKFAVGGTVPLKTQQSLWDNPLDYNVRNNFMDYSHRALQSLHLPYKNLATNPGKASWGQVMSILSYYTFKKLNYNDVPK